MTETTILSMDEANELVLEHQIWAEKIAKSVARGWNLHWQDDGLDGAAFEALIFCARRFDPKLGVPFKSYARRRIHEASTEAARNSKSWEKDSRNSKRTERLARAISAELFELYPQIRSGILPSEDDSEQGVRVGIQQLLISACLISTKHGIQDSNPEEATEFKQLIINLSDLEPLHQLLVWKVYWEGLSLRGVATEWNTDELNVIREHKVIMEYLQKSVSTGKELDSPRIRPGLKDANVVMAHKEDFGIFTKKVSEFSGQY